MHGSRDIGGLHILETEFKGSLSSRVRPLVAMTSIALCMLLSACGRTGPGSASQPSGITHPTTFSSSGDRSKGIPVSVPDDPRVRPDVQLINCGSTIDGWSAGGIVQNSLDRPVTMVITVFFTSTQASDLAASTTTVPLAKGQSKLWSTQAAFAAPSQVLCVLRGVVAR
jgi:hypothetical protein